MKKQLLCALAVITPLVFCNGLLLAESKPVMDWIPETSVDELDVLKDAKTGDPAAQFAYGMMNFEKENYATAAEWFLKAANQGHQNAQYHLGIMYRDQIGLPRNFVRAYLLFSLSENKNFEPAIKAKKEIAKVMSPEQIADAQKLYKQYKPLIP